MDRLRPAYGTSSTTEPAMAAVTSWATTPRTTFAWASSGDGFRAEVAASRRLVSKDWRKLAIGNVFAGYSYPGYYRSGVGFPPLK